MRSDLKVKLHVNTIFDDGDGAKFENNFTTIKVIDIEYCEH